MKKLALLTTACILLFSTNAHAGWYEITNYEGSIGTHPVHLSLQTFNALDEGKDKKVDGSYYYDAQRKPIRLHGEPNANGDLKLCETLDGKNSRKNTDACPMVLSIKKDGATGTWKNDKTSFDIVLSQVGRLDDTDKNILEGKVEIPMWYRSGKHMLIGVYGASAACGIGMRKLDIVNIANGKIDDEVNYENDECDVGMLMTPIYMNVEKGAGKKSESLTIHYRDARTGFDKEYVVKSK